MSLGSCACCGCAHTVLHHGLMSAQPALCIWNALIVCQLCVNHGLTVVKTCMSNAKEPLVGSFRTCRSDQRRQERLAQALESAVPIIITTLQKFQFVSCHLIKMAEERQQGTGTLPSHTLHHFGEALPRRSVRKSDFHLNHSMAGVSSSQPKIKRISEENLSFVATLSFFDTVPGRLVMISAVSIKRYQNSAPCCCFT